MPTIFEEITKCWGNTGNIWIYSDPHFSDMESYLIRFPDLFGLAVIPQNGGAITDEEIVKKLDEMQVRNINSKCGKKDTLIILGDVGNIEYVKKLKAGRKILIMGNHDKGASNYKRKVSVEHTQPLLDNTWRNIMTEYSAKPDFKSFSFVDLPDETLGRVLFDNCLFDEVYEGPLFIGSKILLSHEPIIYPYGLNIHGHRHGGPFKHWVGMSYLSQEKTRPSEVHHYNVIAEGNGYYPYKLKDIIDEGILSNIKDIHRATADFRIEEKENK